MGKVHQPTNEVKVWNPQTGTLDLAETTDSEEMEKRALKAEKEKAKKTKHK